ncbi:MAG: rhodanese-like domain-containing protein [Clostridiales bacterium]|nr:rhodanese-like domain-containing protein [Clostridiales bacterium]
MGFWDFSKPVDINSKLAQARAMENAVIIDVREPREYEYGHIPGAVNLPVNSVGTIRTALDGWLIKGHESQTPLFLYCVSGARSRKAAGLLKAIGFQMVENMGGTNRYTGQFEKGPMPAAPAASGTAKPETETAMAGEPQPAAAPGLDDLEGPVTDPRADALTAEAVAELEGGNVEVRRFDSEDAAKVYLMGRISSQLDMQRGLLLFNPKGQAADGPGAQIILVGGGQDENR